MPIAPSTAPVFTSIKTSTPTAGPLASDIITSASRLFFISWKFPMSSRREWHLVQVQLDSSMALTQIASSQAGTLSTSSFAILATLHSIHETSVGGLNIIHLPV
eukprot:scaffold13641_cov42-Cyclotella_meneghiniana.AAC.2